MYSFCQSFEPFVFQCEFVTLGLDVLLLRFLEYVYVCASDESLYRSGNSCVICTTVFIHFKRTWHQCCCDTSQVQCRLQFKQLKRCGLTELERRRSRGDLTEALIITGKEALQWGEVFKKSIKQDNLGTQV